MARTIHFESLVENVEKFILTLQLRSRLKWNYGTAHIFWYMMRENMQFWCHLEVVCFHGFHEIFLEYV